MLTFYNYRRGNSMKFIQNTTFTAFFMTLGLLLMLISCKENKTNYRDIQFPIIKGGATKRIYAECLAWEDGCNIYCRCPNQPVGYITIQVIRKCIERLIVQPVCISNDQLKLQECNEAIPTQC